MFSLRHNWEFCLYGYGALSLINVSRHFTSTYCIVLKVFEGHVIILMWDVPVCVVDTYSRAIGHWYLPLCVVTLKPRHDLTDCVMMKTYFQVAAMSFTPCQISELHVNPSNFFQITLINIAPSMPWSYNMSVSFRFCTKTIYVCLFWLMHATCLTNLILLYLMILTVFGSEFKFWSCSWDSQG
jgi:hypothetical protein